MKCDLKGNLHAYSSLATGQINTGDVKVSTMTAEQIVDAFNDFSTLIMEPDFAERVKDMKGVREALRGIREMKEYGMVLVPGDNRIASALKNFFNQIVTSDEQLVDYVNGLPFMSKNGLALTKDGKGYKSNMTAEQLNAQIHRMLGTSINNKELKYFAKSPTTGKILISKRLQRDMNRHMYMQYVNEVGSIAEQALMDDPDTPIDLMEAAQELKSGPVISHLYKRLQALYKGRREAFEANEPEKTADFKRKIDEIQDTIEELKQTQDINKITMYLKGILSDVNIAIQKASESDLSGDQIIAHSKSLDLIISAANLSGENPIFTKQDLMSVDLVDELQDYMKMALRLKAIVDKMEVETVMKDADSVLNDLNEDDKEDFLVIRNLRNKVFRMAQSMLGPHHIDNPIISYITELVDTALVRANALARAMNRLIQEKFKPLKDSDFDLKKFSQRDESGITGYMTDVFSAKWHRTKSRGKIFFDKNRRLNVIELNPEILFLKPEGDPGRVALENEIRSNLGDYMADKYLAEAKQLWDDYNTSFESLKRSVEGAHDAEEQIADWEMANSPLKRIQNFHKKLDRGSDRFLVMVPRKIGPKGEDLGFYDENYNDIQNDPFAMEFYIEAREAHIKNMEALNKHQQKFNPPKLGYISKDTRELMSKGKYKEALLNSAKGFSTDFAEEGLVQREHPPVDPITGEFQPQLAQELHSVADEISLRLSRALSSNTEYQSLLDSDDTEALEALEALEMQIRKEVADEVESDKSDDLLQSIVLSNYSLSNLIEKRAVENKVILAMRVFKNQVRANADKSTALAEAKAVAEEVITHYLNKNFYNYKDLDVGGIINPTKAQKAAMDQDKRKSDLQTELAEVQKALEDTPEDKKLNRRLKSINKELASLEESLRGVTDRSSLTAGRKVMMYSYMGWSALTSVNNFLVGQFSNLIQAVDGQFFNVPDYLAGLSDMATPKNRELLDKLYVTGDLAFEFEKRTIHEDNNFWRKLKPLYLQTSMEKVNQGAVALAIMKGIQVTNSKTGETMDMHSAIDDNGDLSDDWTTEEFPKLSGLDLVAKIVVTKIRPINMRAAGDYISPLTAETNVLARAASVFTKFLPEMVADRLGNRRKDHKLGIEVEGRYRSAWHHLANKLEGKTSDELTKRNFRTAMFEVGLAAMAKIVYFAMLKGLCDSEQCKEQHPSVLVALNVLGKATDDVFNVMATPVAVVDKLYSPLAIEGLLTNWYRVLDDTAALVVPGGDTGRYKKKTDGHLKGDARVSASVLKVIPGLSTTVGRYNVVAKKVYPPKFYSTFLSDD
jgi:hypothetical protein